MHQLVLTVVHYVALHKNGLLALVGGSGALSAAIQFILVKFHVNGPKASFVISHVMALLTAGATFLVSNVNPNVGVTYGWIWLGAQFWHRFVVNPSYQRYMVPFLTWLASQKAAAAPVAPAIAKPVVAAPDPNALAV